MADLSTPDLSRVLGRLPLFHDVSAASRERLAAASRLRSLERGAAVFHQGDPCDHFHVVLTGQVKLAVVAPNGQEKVIEIVGPGGSFAEALMFLNLPCRVGAVALLPTTLVSVPREAVLEELAADPQLAMCMLAGLSRRLHGLVHDLEAQSLQSGVQRVIGYFLNMQEVTGLNEDIRNDGGATAAVPKVRTVTLPVSKATIASRLSLTPEYFSRVLRELEDAELISVEGRNIHVRNVRRLAAYPD
ncbi:MAG: Crp/Fnr family transcriptional regulator [Hydrogenophaga sp.]|nr:Crp/Fnr family transcriptional regulator [Hydrogenophaga sp.]